MMIKGGVIMSLFYKTQYILQVNILLIELYVLTCDPCPLLQALPSNPQEEVAAIHGEEEQPVKQ